jgi:hypothetical protein
MILDEVRKLNESMLLSLHSACVRDINQACLCFSLHLNSAEAIVNMPIETVKKIANSSNILLYPPMIPVEAWETFGNLKDDAISAITVTQVISNCH